MQFSQDQVMGVIAIIVAAAMGGIVIGQTTLAVAIVFIAGKISSSPVVLSILEKLFLSLSPDWQAALKGVVKVGDEVVDDVPADTLSLDATAKA